MDSEYRLYRKRLEPYRELVSQLPQDDRKTLLIVSGRGMNVLWAQIWTFLSTSARLQGYRVAVLTTHAQEHLNRYFRLMSITPIFLEDLMAEIPRELPADLREQILAATTYDQLKSLVYKDMPIGEIAMSTHARYKGSGVINVNDPEFLAGVRRWLITVWHAMPAAEQVMERYSVRQLWFTETFFEEFGSFYYTALNRGLDVIRFAGTVRDDAFIIQRRNRRYDRLHHAGLSSETLDEILRIPDAARVETDLMGNFADRYGDKWLRAMRNHPKAKRMAVEEARASLGVPPGRKIAVVYSHILYDMIFFHGTDLFKDYATWLIETVREAIANDRLEWFIKVHPSNIWRGELNTLLGGRYEEERLIEEHFGTLPPHVHIVPADSSISPLTWMQLADYGVTVRGTAGLEMAALGKTVILGGTGRYEGNGFTQDPTTQEEYRALLQRLPDLPPLTAEQMERARRYAYGVFVLKPFTIESLGIQIRNNKKRVGLSDDMMYIPHPWDGRDVPDDLKRFAAFCDDLERIDLLADWQKVGAPPTVSAPNDADPAEDGLASRVGELMNRGLALYNAGDVAGAAAAWGEVLEWVPNHKGVLNNYAVCMKRLERWDEAADAFGRILMIDREDHQARFNFALACSKLGQVRNARRVWQELLAANPRHQEARQQLERLPQAG
ncbi:MAG TPA: hypothetical protein VD978_25695 [Azospirillum sp.]|nr:hypothetical protein [Azospirillum sp.]